MTRHWRMHCRLAVLGTGSALPGASVTSEALVALIGERFRFTRRRQALGLAERLAIRTRHICRDFERADEPARAGDANPDLAARAVQMALVQAGLATEDLGYLIGHTTTPLRPLPANVALVAESLGYEGPHVELRQACTGFANGLMIASGLLAAPDARPVVIVGSETGSLFFDPTNANADNGQLVNMMQMGDGAAAIVLGPARDHGPHIEAAWYGAMGNGRGPGISIASAKAGCFEHDFASIAQHGSVLFEAGIACLEAAGYGLDDFDAIIPHQVSGAIGGQLAVHLNVPEERFFGNAAECGNTGSAANWLALDQWRAAAHTGRIAVLGAEASKFMFGGFVYDGG